MATNNLGGTSADGEYSYDPVYAAKIASQQNLPTVIGSGEVSILNTPVTTVAGTSNTTNSNPVQKNVGKDPKPGTRLKNPLGNFSSYTYQISMYMITPDAYAKFVSSGRKNINEFTKTGTNGASGGAYVIIQSGGVNTALDQRPPDMKYDYYIDDLKVINAVAGKETQTSSNLTKITFNIVEPIGFSLITKLKKAREALAKVSNIPNIEKALDPSKHFYVLGIRFQGYDVNGELVNASKYFSDDTFNTSPDASGVYERFYDFKIQKVGFKLGPGSTIYNITAIPISTDVGMHIARATVDNNVELVAGTVEEALNGSGQGITSLFQTINTNMLRLKNAKSREFPDEYNVRWLGLGAVVIKDARLKSVANTDKKKSASSPANNSRQVNDATGQRVAYDNQRVKIPITQGMSILQAIQKVIKQSSYLEDALDTLFKSEETLNKDTASPDKIVQKDPPTLRWYNLSTDIEVIGFDTKINDFAYKITYVIQPYDTPAAVSPYGKTAKYYGPHKRYQYWYTGENSEILSYELQYDNTYFNIVLNPAGDPATSGGAASVAQLGNKPTNQERTGFLTPGSEAQNTYLTSLFDPSTYSKAKLTILGDPDFLMRDSSPGINEVYRQFYQSDNFTINPNGGQVFIEVKFNEGIDYNNQNGTMDINDSIFFWNYPDNIRTKIQGVSYMVSECESSFKSGKFTQTLKLIFNTMPAALEEAATAVNERATDSRTAFAATDPRRIDIRTPNSGSTPTPGSNVNNASGNTGLMQDDVTGVDAAVQRNTEADLELQREFRRGSITSISTGNPSNPTVADDDSVINAGSTQAGSSNQSEIGSDRPINQDNILNNT